MAKRSDFAQKLLDDLRVRKERMAAPAQSSKRSNAMAIDAYAYSKQTYGGSRDTRTGGTTSSRTGYPQNRTSGSSRTLGRQEASNQMVTYGRGRNSGQMVDLSMALAFALENGATKLTRTSSLSKSSVMGFLNQIGRESMDFNKTERKGNVNMYWGSSSQFPNLSNFHIEEISRGAQKLNQILRACSRGVNAGKFSIEIGKELFEGAIDLEESLRMLVNLQEASEYMTSSQRKSRITLLEEDEEDEDQVEEQKQLSLPRFSFDKSTRNARKIQEVGRMALQSKTAALTYPTGGSMDEKQGREMAASVSRRHSVSYTPDVKNQSKLSEQKVSKPEKDRIPNVIAKLMGLDELPRNENTKSTTTQKDNIPKKPRERGAAIGHTMQQSSKISGVKTKESENVVVSTSKQKVVEGTKNPLMQKNTAFLLQAENVLPASNAGLETVIHDGKQPSKNLIGIKPVTRSGKTTTINTDKQQSAQIKQNSSKDNRERERKQDTIRSGEQKLQVRKQQGTEMISKSTSKVAKQPHTSQVRVNRNSMTEAVDAARPRGVPNGTYQENSVRRKSSAELNIHMNDLSQKHSAQENLDIPPAMKEKSVHHVAPLAKTRRVNKSEIPRRMDEAVTRRNGTLKRSTRPQKTSYLEQVTHRTHDKVSGHNGAEKGRGSRLKQAEPRIVKSNKSTENTQHLHLVQNLQKEAEAPTFYGHNEDEFQSLQEPKTLVPHDSPQNSESVEPNDQQHQAPPAPPIFGADDCITTPNDLNRTQSTHEESQEALDISSLVQVEKQKPWRKTEPLTESETILKQIVIQSQLFLNTAEAFLRLEIPYEILNNSNSNHDHDYNSITHPEDIKLTLDCSYEIMKRKGRRQELAGHPHFVKVPISFVEVLSLDELVKQLSGDIEKLRMYGKNGRLECGPEEYVPRMLEFDVNNKEAELNCMWDLGWDVSLLGFVEVDEVVRDLERAVLSGLVDELTRDLFHM